MSIYEESTLSVGYRVTKNAKIDREKDEEIVISRAARISAAKTPIISILVVIVTTERDDLVVLK